jgi:hypothetical protein
MRNNPLELPVGCPWGQPGKRVLFDSSGSSTSTTQNFSPEEAAARAGVQSEAKRIYDATSAATSQQPYPGAQPAPFAPQTLAAQQYAQDYALGPALTQANNINKAVSFGLSDVLYPETNPALRQTINASIRPITESYTDTGGVMSQIRDGAVNAGQFGGSRQGIAEGIAAGRYADAVGDTASKIATDGYGKGLDTFSRTLAFAPQAIQTGLMPSNILSGIGAQYEGQGQQLNDYLGNYNMWDYNAPWTPLQNYANIVYGGSNPTTSSQVNQGSNPMQMIGAAGTAALGFSQLLPLLAASDPSIKENVQLVGVDDRTKLNLYEFNYIGQPDTRYRGVMADEVRRVRPDAVLINKDGHMMVNYTALGIPFVKLSPAQEGANYV